MSVLGSVTDPYSAGEARFYDAVIAPAVAELVVASSKDLLAAMKLGGELLDVGCGGGQNLHQIAAMRPDLALTGVNLSPDQVARARDRLGDRADVVEGDALRLPFGDGSFDGVISIASIKHWPDMGAGIAECVRVLRPGGLAVIAEADRGCRLADASRFVEAWRIPASTRTVFLAIFRTWVAGQAIDLDDARALAAGVDSAAWTVERVPDQPALLMRGLKL